MLGQMMEMPLLISSILEHAARHHGDTEIVSRRIEGDIHRYTYRQCLARTKQLANSLIGLGVVQSDRVATLAWNGYRHMETYYGVGGMGAVVHTINPRLHPDQITWILNHAEDKVIFYDKTFAPIIAAVRPRCPQVLHWIEFSDTEYEPLIAKASTQFDWPQIDERSAVALCYTSGTTGNPKGALYSHRSTILHAYASCLPDAMNIGAKDCILPVVPMFHVNAWGLPYASALVGAKLVFPGAQLDGKSIYELFEQEKVTFSGGVPTVWLGLLQYVGANNLMFSTLRRTVVGGSACPPSTIDTFRDKYNVEVVHAWGMTELSPLGTLCKLQYKHTLWPQDKQRKLLEKQGHVIYGVDMKIVDDTGAELPWDGKTFGNLLVRGPWVIQDYFKGEGGHPLQYDAAGRGWFPTGDVGTIDEDGYLQITDRSKDVIKSGGEWISSIDLENLAQGHPAVLQAAVIGLPHPKWDERPLLIIVKKPHVEVSKQDILAFYEGKIAKFWMPDDVAFVEAIPLGATGKILKTKLRETFADYAFPV
jgi:3-(methylthio)propionyl---CoA ligase